MRAIRKTPIVVNDSRGFYTSRVVTTYIGEGHLMLTEGVPAAMIENAARMAGMPVGPLALNDEVAVDLSLRIMDATRADLGVDAVPAAQYRLIEEMVADSRPVRPQERQGLLRLSRHACRKEAAVGRARRAPPPRADPDAIDVGRLKERFLAIMALETARCFEEKVLTDVREADVGSILGFGFAPFTGGTLSYIDFMGATNFVDRLQPAGANPRPAIQAESAAARHGAGPARRSTAVSRRRRVRPRVTGDKSGRCVAVAPARESLIAAG